MPRRDSRASRRNTTTGSSATARMVATIPSASNVIAFADIPEICAVDRAGREQASRAEPIRFVPADPNRRVGHLYP